MQLLTYSRTTEQKLKDSYKTLKDINNDIKQTATTQGEKLKKKTLKDFKENKKIIDDDKNILYNVYLKYKEWFIISGEDTRPTERDEIMSIIPGTYILVRWELKNSTIQAYGKTNIIDEIKSFIDVTMSASYTYKIKILDVHVNKEIYQPKQYRYLGAKKSYDAMKHKSYIKYFKAWNATFNYKGFNLDMNNDIEFECVPNALFKTYGTKKETSNQYLHSVHKGGLDYVKKVLSRNNTTQVETPTNYVNPYDEMIKNAENMVKELFNQYEYNIDYEFDVDSVDDIKDEKIKNEIESLYKSINEYTEQKDILHNNKNPYGDDTIIKTNEAIIEELKLEYKQNINKNNNNKNPYEDDKIIKTKEKRIEELKTQYKQVTNNNEKVKIMDSIHSLQKEMGQYHNDKYLWEKENDYEYINFKIMDSIKSIEKEIEQYRNKQNLWDKQYKGGKQHKGGKPVYSSDDILYYIITQGEKLKKKTLKDFKENKTIIDDDKIYYIMYILI